MPYSAMWALLCHHATHTFFRPLQIQYQAQDARWSKLYLIHMHCSCERNAG